MVLNCSFYNLKVPNKIRRRLALNSLQSFVPIVLQYDDALTCELNSPSLNNATAGEDGGNGIICSLAFWVDSLSTPAKTVVKFDLVFSLQTLKMLIAPGLAVPAAHPHTEFTTTRRCSFFCQLHCQHLQSLYTMLQNHALVSSSRIGFTNSSGYIISNINSSTNIMQFKTGIK